VSPDGHNVYVAATASNAVSIFARNAQTGTVRQLAGQAGCISETGNRGACRDGAGLWGVSAVVVAPNGRHAYAPGFYSSAVAVLARTPPPRRSGR
jgi:DNA-binding beta-propeller fold protein YncE